MTEELKLFDFEEKDDFFDPYRLFIKLADDSAQHGDKFEYLDQKRIGILAHENQHFLNFIGSPVGIYDTLIRITALTQTSFHLKMFLHDQDKLRIPFLHNIGEHPAIANGYNISAAITSYLFAPIGSQSLFSIDDIKNFKLGYYDCNQLSVATQNKIKKKFPVLIVSSNKNAGILPRLVPVGLQVILEGFARLNQDSYLKKHQKPDQFLREYEKRLSMKEYTPYYILQSYVDALLDGLSIREKNVLISVAFFLSLVCLRPINQWPYVAYSYFGFFEKFLTDEAEHFLSNLSHPGNTFIEALSGLKEMAQEKGGVPIDKKGIVSLIDETCQRIGGRSLKYLYKMFCLYLSNVIEMGFPIGSPLFPYTKHYFEISLSLMKAASDNPYDYIFNPWDMMNKLGNSIRPMIFGQEYVIADEAEDKTDWFLFSSIIQQFFKKRRIFCYKKIFFGTNAQCKNDKECSLDKTDYPYDKCTKDFIDLINWVIGDVNTLIPA